jgi:acetolactate synthase-1/2/3 large subunit
LVGFIGGVNKVYYKKGGDAEDRESRMKQRVADYIADFLVSRGITDLFTVTGGGAMHLNDAFGHHPKLHCVYNHHEQACAMAAEAYTRINNKIAVVCVTSGPGGTNAITGVLGGWQDSIPMLIISGQVRYNTTVRSTGLVLRSYGGQECDIVTMVTSITKYAEMVVDPFQIRFYLEKMLYLACEGRPGPVWLDIPFDVQGCIVETDDLTGYRRNKNFPQRIVSNDLIRKIIEKIKSAERPVLNAGSSIRTSGSFQMFEELIENLNIPVVTGWNSTDLIHTNHFLYVGRAGTMGDRAGNFAVQNSDLLLSLGSRLNIYQVGYNYKTWAREAFTIVVDIDFDELRKPNLHVDMPVCADVKEIIEKMNIFLGNVKLSTNTLWHKRCQEWKKKYPVVQSKHYKEKNTVNVYAFINELSRLLPEKSIVVVGNGSASVVGSQAFFIKKRQRFIMNCAVSAMGYDLPAAIGACIANDRKEVICITGDGSIQMNLQELQTIKTNGLPIKIFLINNDGYHQIRLTQKNFFQGPHVGIGPESNDLGFPEMKKLAPVYGFQYESCTRNDDLRDFITDVLKENGAVIGEVFVSKNQMFEPKMASKKLAGGVMVSAPLEDLAPFLPREEFLSNMIIDPVGE